MRDCSEGYFGTFDSEQQDGSQDNRKQRGAQCTSDSVQVKTVRDCSEGYFGAFDSEQQDGSQDNRKQRGTDALLTLFKTLQVNKWEPSPCQVSESSLFSFSSFTKPGGNVSFAVLLIGLLA